MFLIFSFQKKKVKKWRMNENAREPEERGNL